ncbi:CTTNBP2 [Acrasis kona]|uniref:CTTNBP2 n=1 Tax=Acrasis kona TaxID=1008807 RepID=A0AAW2Z4C8_9EUKA
MSEVSDLISNLTREEKLVALEELKNNLSKEDDAAKEQTKKRPSESQHDEQEKKKTKLSDELTDEITKTSNERILEMGHIYFFYRPKVGVDKVQGVQDVQRFFFILKPISANDAEAKKNRLVVVGKKMMPYINQHQNKSNAFWSCIDIASNNLEDLTKELTSKTYDTITKGQRTVEEVRIVGEGHYSFVRNKDNSTSLAYVLEMPQEVTPVQKAFNIEKEASYTISVKNPGNPPQQQEPIKEEDHSATFITGQRSSPNQNNQPSSGRHVSLPDHLKELFKANGSERTFIALNPIDFLEYEGLEMLLIGTSADLVQELGEAGKIVEEEAEQEAKEGVFDSAESLFKELKMRGKDHPIAPLSGKWE